MPTAGPPIILFYYPFSPWSKKVTTYLALRAIPFTLCEQPFTMPRPDLAALGVDYRRIPLMSIGRDIYCDTLLIIEKLEEFFPHSHLSAKYGYDLAMERLLEKWTDLVVFKYAAESIPSQLPALKDENFIQDRTELWGRDWRSEHQDSLRPVGLTVLRDNFKFLEETVLYDGREWILGGDNPQLADIHAGWVLDWLLEIPEHLPEDLFGKDSFPKVRAWLERYRTARNNATERMEHKISHIQGHEAVSQILKGDFGEPEGVVDEMDPSKLIKGDQVEGWPTDTGWAHHDRGTLSALTSQEAVIASKSRQDGVEIRIHHPRWQFKIVKADKAESVN